ncbi:type II toxin-antitoxin system VapC family toxin [Tsukamurella sp. DT100]|uniref:type II toxin-antitoxin system VapC family toxin n=1 Tax=Tsukamurella sp. DT100 TaxID=3393415 RepID=UPI003CF1025C
MRAGLASDETTRLLELVGRLDLYPLDDPTAHLALSLAVSYGLRAADSVHLATAIAAGADRFLTNNRKDFPKSIREIDVIYPDDLPDPGDDPAGPGDESGE